MEKRFEDANSSGVVPKLPRGSAVLSLTNIRSFQQSELEKAHMLETRQRNYGKAFKTKKEPPKFCQKYKSLLLNTNEKGQVTKAHIRGVPCNTWACPYCQIKKAYRLKFQLIEIIKLNNLDHKLTLTLKPSLIPVEYTKRGNKTGYYVTKLFNNLRTDLARKFKKPLKYVWVKEFQDNGDAHLHIMLSGYLPIRYLRSKWVRIGGGNEMKIEKVLSVEASAVYMTTYVVKSFKGTHQEDTFRVGERRYAISHSCVKPEPYFSKTIKIPSINSLVTLLPTTQFFDVYNSFQDPSALDKELILAPHQESLLKP